MFLLENSQLFLTMQYGIWKASKIKNFSCWKLVMVIGVSSTYSRVKLNCWKSRLILVSVIILDPSSFLTHAFRNNNRIILRMPKKPHKTKFHPINLTWHSILLKVEFYWFSGRKWKESNSKQRGEEWIKGEKETKVRKGLMLLINIKSSCWSWTLLFLSPFPKYFDYNNLLP